MCLWKGTFYFNTVGFADPKVGCVFPMVIVSILYRLYSKDYTACVIRTKRLWRRCIPLYKLEFYKNAVKVSKHRLVIQKFGLTKPVRVCDLCHDVLTQKTLTSGYTQNNWFYRKCAFSTGSSTIWPEIIIFKFIHFKIIASKNTVNAQRSIFAHSMYIIK